MGRSKIQMQKYDKFQIGFWISRQTAPMFEMSHLHLCIMATLQRRVLSKPLLQPNMETHLKRLISSSLHLNFLEGGSRVIAHKNREPEEADDTLCGLSPGYHLVRFSQMKCLWMSAAAASGLIGETGYYQTQRHLRCCHDGLHICNIDCFWKKRHRHFNNYQL